MFLCIRSQGTNTSKTARFHLKVYSVPVLINHGLKLGYGIRGADFHNPEYKRASFTALACIQENPKVPESA